MSDNFTITQMGKTQDGYDIFEVTSKIIKEHYYPNNHDIAETIINSDRTTYNRLVVRIRELNNLVNGTQYVPSSRSTVLIPTLYEFQELMPSLSLHDPNAELEIEITEQERELIIYNIDPTQGTDEIISQSGDVGHTWVSIDGEHFGWGYPQNVNPSSGNTVPGALLNTLDSNRGGRTITSTYRKMITGGQGESIKNYFRNLVNNLIGYNLGGSAKDPLATMCTEAVINALNNSGVLTPEEWDIINTPYEPWGCSFPENIPLEYQEMAPNVTMLTSPNPNAFEYRMNQLNNQSN